MKNIEVKILDHNMNGMAKFLARLTQRGHLINCMDDLMGIYNDAIKTPPSEKLLSLPHSTIRRMNYLTVAITGLSTKAVSQIRTHAKRLTFISTSTQYSRFDGRPDNFVIPDDIPESVGPYDVDATYNMINMAYAELLAKGVDRDTASYFLPQGLRKALIISGNLDDWQYVIRTRLCNRNTKEVQYIMKLIYKEIEKVCGKEYTVGMLPSCVNGQCSEGKFCCGKKFEM